MTPNDVGLRIKFGGRPNEISVDTFISSLSALTDAISGINADIGEGRKLDIRIRALKQSSFLVEIGIAPTTALELLKSVDWKVIPVVVTTLVGILTLYKFLKGKKPKEVIRQGNENKLVNEFGDNITVNLQTFNIFKDNESVNNAIKRTFTTLDVDTSIDSFELEDVDEKPLFQAERGDFAPMSGISTDDIVLEDTRVVPETTTLLIVKLVFEKGRKWDFLRQDQKISAAISDESFFANIDKGEPFAKGDALQVEMEVTQVLDKKLNVYVEQSYVVTKVMGHIKRSNQDSLDV